MMPRLTLGIRKTDIKPVRLLTSESTDVILLALKPSIINHLLNIYSVRTEARMNTWSYLCNRYLRGTMLIPFSDPLALVGSVVRFSPLRSGISVNNYH